MKIGRAFDINDLHKPAVNVTDHAVLRYAERVHGLDVDAIRREIESHFETRFGQVPDGKYPISGKLRAKVIGGNVVTVY